jgi:type IV pilus assembly protein PilY1
MSTTGAVAWTGKLYRLTTGGCVYAPCTTATWGGNAHGPTVVLDQFPASLAMPVGPVTAAPTLTMDDASALWVFFGTGRYFSAADKTNTDPQYLFGVKDPVPTGGCTETTLVSCARRNLIDVSNAAVCVVCVDSAEVTGVPGVSSLLGTTTTTLQGKIQTMDGWFTTLSMSGERILSNPLLIGGAIFFSSFQPLTDPCEGAGTASLYALFYETGSAYKGSVVGTDASGSNTNASRSISMGEGLPSQMAIQIGAQGSGGVGTTIGTGCSGQLTGFLQSSTGTLNQFCGNLPSAVWSRLVSWQYENNS